MLFSSNFWSNWTHSLNLLYDLVHPLYRPYCIQNCPIAYTPNEPFNMDPSGCYVKVPSYICLTKLVGLFYYYVFDSSSAHNICGQTYNLSNQFSISYCILAEYFCPVAIDKNLLGFHFSLSCDYLYTMKSSKTIPLLITSVN